MTNKQTKTKSEKKTKISREKKVKPAEKSKKNEGNVIEKKGTGVKKEIATKKKETKEKINVQEKFYDPYQTIMYPVSTEKSIRLMESENKLIFRVSLKSKKSEIKKAIEELFKAKVVSVKTLITQNGHKRAYIKFGDETPAIDIATQLGMM